jgi:hypothetical protein
VIRRDREAAEQGERLARPEVNFAFRAGVEYSQAPENPDLDQGLIASGQSRMLSVAINANAHAVAFTGRKAPRYTYGSSKWLIQKNRFV